MTYDNYPYIFVKSGEDVVYRMSRITWSNFAYFNTIVHDHVNKENYSNIIEIEFIDDVDDFWKFLKNDFPTKKIDFSLNVKTICITFGILDNNNIFLGRLKHLLVESALEYFSILEKTFPLYSLDYSFSNFSNTINYKKKVQQAVIKLFTEITLEDPRCQDIWNITV